MIMIPLMISQIFLFPIAVGYMMDNWTEQRVTLELQEISNHIGSAIYQLYSAVNHDTIATGTVTSRVDVDQFLNGYAYTANASLRTAVDESLNSSKILDTTFMLLDAKRTTIQTSITLGYNVQWIDSTFSSNSTNAGIIATKLSDGTIQLSFIA